MDIESIITNIMDTNNVSRFKSTYLIIRQHKISKKLYLHKTVRLSALETYLGSGKYWTNHITKYGKNETEILWFCLFDEPIELIRCAITLSYLYDIVNSDEWCNQIIEIGLGGAAYGHPGALKGIPRSSETKQKISDSLKKYERSDSHSENISKALTGRRLSSDHKIAISIGNSGEKNPFFGKKHTDETKQKWSIIRTGKNLSDEHKQSISAGLKNSVKNKRLIIFYDNTDNEVLTIDGKEFYSYCVEHSLPFSKLKETLYDKTIRVNFDKPFYKEKYSAYIGWYCRTKDQSQ